MTRDLFYWSVHYSIDYADTKSSGLGSGGQINDYVIILQVKFIELDIIVIVSRHDQHYVINTLSVI